MGISNGLIGRIGARVDLRADRREAARRRVVAGIAAASAMLALAGCGQGTTAARRTVTAAVFGAYPGRPVPELAISGLAAAHGELVAVGAAAGRPAVWHRTPGGTWSLASPVPARPGLVALAGVAYGPDGWLAVGSRLPVILTSADSMSWRTARRVTRDLGGVSSALSAAGPAGYVIIGKLVKRGGACAADIWWSPDLGAWAHAHDVNDTTGSSDVLAVAAGPARVRVRRPARRQASGVDDSQRPGMDDHRPARAAQCPRGGAPAGCGERDPRGRAGRRDHGERDGSGQAVRRVLSRWWRKLAPGAAQLPRTWYHRHRADRRQARLRGRRPVYRAWPSRRRGVGIRRWG